MKTVLFVAILTFCVCFQSLVYAEEPPYIKALNAGSYTVESRPHVTTTRGQERAIRLAQVLTCVRSKATLLGDELVVNGVPFEVWSLQESDAYSTTTYTVSQTVYDSTTGQVVKYRNIPYLIPRAGGLGGTIKDYTSAYISSDFVRKMGKEQIESVIAAGSLSGVLLPGAFAAMGSMLGGYSVLYGVVMAPTHPKQGIISIALGGYYWYLSNRWLESVMRKVTRRYEKAAESLSRL